MIQRIMEFWFHMCVMELARLAYLKSPFFLLSTSFIRQLSCIPFHEWAWSLPTFLACWKGMVDAALISDRMRDSNHQHIAEQWTLSFRLCPLHLYEISSLLPSLSLTLPVSHSAFITNIRWFIKFLSVVKRCLVSYS